MRYFLPPPLPFSSPVISPLPGPALCIPPITYFFLSSISSYLPIITLSHYYLALLLFDTSTSFSLFSTSTLSSPSLIPLSLYFISVLLFFSSSSCSPFSIVQLLSLSSHYIRFFYHPAPSIHLPGILLLLFVQFFLLLLAFLVLLVYILVFLLFFSFSSFSSSSSCTSCAFSSDSYSFSAPTGKVDCEKLETWNVFQILVA